MLSRTLVVAVLVLLNGFFVAAEFALVRSRRTRLEALTRTGAIGARAALRAASNLPRMLSASQLGISIVSLTLGWVATEVLADAFAEYAARLPLVVEFSLRATLGATAAVLAVVYFHVVFGELAPRSAALNQPEQLARWLAPPLLAFAWVASPFLWVLTHSARLVLRVFGQKVESRDEVVHSPDELRLLVEQSGERGTLERQDAEFIEGVFEFSEKNAREVMTPRTAIVAIPADASLDEALRAVVDGGFSRYPVFEETIDDIVGVVLAKDLLRLVASGDGRGPATGFTLRELARPVHVVPGTREVEEVLADFKRLKEHICIVLDEYGGTAGLVTMEDLLEEIVGEILDEYDDAVPGPANGTEGSPSVEGSEHVGELNARFGLAIPDEEYTTIGGFVFGTLGRVPRVGDRVSAGGAIFTVRELHGRRIARIEVDLHTLGDRRGAPRDPDDPRGGGGLGAE